jgi:serine/alanine adding enzyme
MTSTPTSKSELATLKYNLKALKEKKALASKAIGMAKQKDEPIGQLKIQVQTISNELRTLEAQIKAQLKCQSVADNPEKDRIDLPPQFQPGKVLKAASGSLKITQNLTSEEWDDYVTQHPNATIYNTSAIKKVIEDTFRHPCHYLAAIDNNREIHGILPLVEMKSRLFGHFMTSLPFFNYGGLLTSNPDAENSLLNETTKLTKESGVNHIELRHTSNHIDLPCKSEKVAMLLNLPKTSEQLWSDLGTKLRAQIKKGQKSNHTVKIGREEVISDFYDVFSRNMRDLGTPVYPISLFSNMIKHCPSARIVVIYIDKLPVSTGFLLGWQNTMEIPWASTLRKANKVDANMVLYWEILKFTINAGYRIFDFGRSSRNAGTYAFKKQWGAKPHDLFWHYSLTNNQDLPKINPDNPKYKLIISLWKKLPLKITHILGPIIVSNIP